jgi:phosphoadenosine phosphosulfate reductase
MPPQTLIAAEEIAGLNARLTGQPTGEILRWAWERFGARAAIGTSFQGACLVMMHLAKTNGLEFPVFTLDTGLLFPETLTLKKRLEDFFGYRIQALEPDLTVAQQEAAQGPELWKSDPNLCCTLRKVLPLRDRLADLDCWITGLRREQSDTRVDVGIVELFIADENSGRDIVKLNPMAGWTRQAVWDYLKKQGIPYNPLHDQGYRSIGCQPCTRKTGEGEDERAGRWTGFQKKECGIHTFMKKK